MARGLRTLFYLRDLMNPFRYGSFALMLISHKLLRWLPFLLTPISVIALGVLALTAHVAALVVLSIAAVVILFGTIGIRHRGIKASKPVALAGFIVAACSAGFLAWCDAIRRAPMATWEPTPRPELQA
jgi:hypothetical protein